jgi:putative membrane protein
LFFIVYGSTAVYAYHHFQHEGIQFSIPYLPLSTLGIAVAFYLGFKNNQSYDRFWEARKIWGGIINYSRTWGNQVLSFVSDMHTSEKSSESEIRGFQKVLIYRHLAYINALRLQLRMPTSFSLTSTKRGRKMRFYKGVPGGEDWMSDVAPFLSCTDEISVIKDKVNTATQIIRNQGDTLNEIYKKGFIEDFRHMEMMRVLEEFYSLQGKCERIKKTPLPRQYSFFSMVFVWIFILLLPFGLVTSFEEMGHNYIWITVPVFVVLAWVFYTMEVIGDNSEDPFENTINDVPMTALCRTIEIDLRDMLDEDNLPEGIKPENGVLMLG